MSTSKFQIAMQPLLKSLGIDAKQLADGNSYRIAFASMTVQIVGTWEGYVVLAANIGKPSAGRDVAWQLLQLNLFGESFPPLQVSAVAEDQTVVLWVQERLSHLDSATLLALFDRFIAQARSLRAWLDQPAANDATRQAAGEHREHSRGLNSLQQRLAYPDKR